MTYRIGLDVGSTTAKLVMIDSEGRLVFSCYKRHHAHIKDVIRDFLSDVRPITGNNDISLVVTGSVGMMTAEMLHADFIQEVVAASEYARTFYPYAKTLIDIGGEDSKVVFFDKNNTDLRMNGNCAGGTGAFIDQMSLLMGITNSRMSELAMQSTSLQNIAARCGVFAKTDVQNLICHNVAEQDIAASIFHSVAVQTITTLAHGHDIQPPLLLCGGPLTFLPALRKAFADYLGLDESQLLISKESNLIPAYGCALRCGNQKTNISHLLHLLEIQEPPILTSSLPPLFKDEEELFAWRKEKSHHKLVVKPMKPHEKVVLGIDSGSTTTKVIASRINGDILFIHYSQSLGHPIQAVKDGLRLLKEESEKQGSTLEIVGSCSTGYGEELIKAAFGLNNGIVETMAHYFAANTLMPGVSFILDIGGQDMKAIFVDKGIVTRMELNEACSSGCGTFLQTFAQSMGYSISEFAQMACMAHHPCDLGTRCTVFMNSKVKQVLREGAGVKDISAGLSYSVVNNCLYKVLKLKDIADLGDKIVVQGGTMRNDSVVRALELITGRKVVRSSHPEMMGALGCALYASNHLTDSKTIDQLLSTAQYDTRQIQCKGCENKCHILRYKFSNGISYHSGNKCERVFTNGTGKQQPGKNIFTLKYQLLFDREVNDKASRRIGVPRVLNMYENYPFWHRLLTDCGFQVVLSSHSKIQEYESALCTVMSDNICFPAKLVHSHIAELNKAGVERILMPYVVYEKKECTTAINSYNCPIVSGYSDVIRSAMTTQVPVDSPVINFGDTQLLQRQTIAYLIQLGISKSKAKQAFKNAFDAQLEYENAVSQKAKEILAESKVSHQMTILLAGRPYHTDPLIQHRLSELIASMGVNVISEDIVRNTPHAADGETNTVRQWAYMNRIIKAAQWVGKEGKDVQFVETTSFGCGPDAFIQDEIRDLLSRYGKSFTLLKIDDVNNNGSLKLRVRSLIESLQLNSESTTTPHVATFQTTRVFTPQDKRKKILAPYISEYITPLLPAMGVIAGYDIEILPPSDAESAEIGLRYANNEVCYPATLIVGDIIKALKSGRYDLNNIAVAMSQTGGQCRATNYAGVIKRAMVYAGFQNIPLITLGVSAQAGGANEQKGFDIPWLKIANTVATALFYADTMAKYYYSAVVREKEAGKAAILRDKYLAMAATAIRQNNANELLQLIVFAAEEFNEITTDKKTRKVGIVGEIFLKFNHFAHQQITDGLIAKGIEVVPPLITPFFLQELVNVLQNKRLGLSPSKRTASTIVKIIYRLYRHRFKQINKAAQHYRYFIPFSDIREESVKAYKIVSPAAQFGEGWLLPGEISEMAECGVKDIISLQPFGCIANHIVAKGVEKAIRKHYPSINLLNLDFDSGVSAVNVTNRLILFLDHQ